MRSGRKPKINPAIGVAARELAASLGASAPVPLGRKLIFIPGIRASWADDKYMQTFFIDTRLMIIGGLGMVWMGIGAFIMSRMVNFEI